MFKKILSLSLALLLILGCLAVFASCGNTTTPDSKTDDQEQGDNTETKTVKAALITLHGDNSTYDKNFIDAFKTACANQGLTADQYAIVTDIPEGTECYDKAAEFADDGYSIVFADSFGHEAYMLQAAKEFTDVEFCHATGTQAHTANVANFHDAFASIYEGRYLAGVAAGLKLVELYGETISDENAKIGYVAAWPYAEVISGYTSFFLGVRSIVANATMEVRYTYSWYDESGEKTTALALIDAGCKLISQHADSMGAPTACEERGIPNVSYNGSNTTSTFVIASKINWVPYFEYAIGCVKEGKKIDADYTGTIATDSVQITALGTAAANGTQAKLDEVKAALAAGTIKVFDCSTFTVKGAKADASAFSKASFITMDDDGHLTAYLADVDDDGTYVGETNVIKTAGETTYFAESEFRSAPYFDIVIDGISIGDTVVEVAE